MARGRTPMKSLTGIADQTGVDSHSGVFHVTQSYVRLCQAVETLLANVKRASVRARPHREWHGEEKQRSGSFGGQCSRQAGKASSTARYTPHITHSNGWHECTTTTRRSTYLRFATRIVVQCLSATLSIVSRKRRTFPSATTRSQFVVRTQAGCHNSFRPDERENR